MAVCCAQLSPFGPEELPVSGELSWGGMAASSELCSSRQQSPDCFLACWPERREPSSQEGKETTSCLTQHPGWEFTDRRWNSTLSFPTGERENKSCLQYFEGAWGCDRCALGMVHWKDCLILIPGWTPGSRDRAALLLPHCGRRGGHLWVISLTIMIILKSSSGFVVLDEPAKQQVWLDLSFQPSGCVSPFAQHPRVRVQEGIWCWLELIRHHSGGNSLTLLCANSYKQW